MSTPSHTLSWFQFVVFGKNLKNLFKIGYDPKEHDFIVTYHIAMHAPLVYDCVMQNLHMDL